MPAGIYASYLYEKQLVMHVLASWGLFSQKKGELGACTVCLSISNLRGYVSESVLKAGQCATVHASTYLIKCYD